MYLLYILFMLAHWEGVERCLKTGGKLILLSGLEGC